MDYEKSRVKKFFISGFNRAVAMKRFNTDIETIPREILVNEFEYYWNKFRGSSLNEII